MKSKTKGIVKSKAKSKARRGSVFTLLLGNYILFTLLLALILIALFVVFILRMVGIMANIDPSQIEDFRPLLYEQRYNEFPTEQLLGKGGAIIVLDERQSLIYQSREQDVVSRLTSADVACIPIYTAVPEITVNQFVTEKKETQTSVSVMELYGETKSYRKYILDGDKRVIYQSTALPSSKLSDLQFKLLTDSLDPSYSLQRYPFQTNSGEAHTLLLLSERSAMEAAIRRSWRSFLMLFPLAYGSVTFLFIFWLNTRIKKPLQLLCQELNSFESGEARQANYRGPKEFVEIFDSFNAMSKRLQSSEAQRQQLEDERQKMLADISHDLKTPITVVQGYAKALCDGVVPADERAMYLKTIEQKASGLNDLINTFYEYSKMEHPAYSLKLELVDICNYLRDYVAEQYAELELSGFIPEVEIPEAHILCNIDQVQLRRAFGNILGNATKHNPPGTSLYFILKPEESQVRILLADNGIGIPQKIRNTIFTPFVVGEASRNSSGSGLGLSIAKKIVEAHHGSIQLLEPEPLYSTIFEIILPTA